MPDLRSDRVWAALSGCFDAGALNTIEHAIFDSQLGDPLSKPSKAELEFFDELKFFQSYVTRLAMRRIRRVHLIPHGIDDGESAGEAEAK